MKKRIIDSNTILACFIILFSFLITKSLYAQNDTINGNSTDSLNLKIDSLVNVNSVLKTFYDRFENDTTGKEILGKLKLTDSLVYIYNFKSSCITLKEKIWNHKEKKGKTDTVSVDVIKEVMLRVENAGIYEIRVETKKGLVFVNRRFIPPLLNWEKRKNRNMLQLASISQKCSSSKAYIYIEDFLDYKAYTRYRMDDMPHPKFMTLKKDSILLTSGSKLENLANLRIYSDLLALINETPNGLVQFEADAFFYINLNPVKRMYLLKYIKPFLHLSRYDSESKYVQIEDNIYDKKVNIDLLQKSNVYSGVEVNLLSRVSTDGNTNFDLNGGGAFFFAPYLTDTLGNSDNMQAMTYFGNVKLITRRIHNFIFDYGFTLSWTFPFEIEGVNYSSKHYLNRIMTGEIRYITSEKDELFLRARYVGDGTNAFNQIQFGYKAQIPIPSTRKPLK